MANKRPSVAHRAPASAPGIGPAGPRTLAIQPVLPEAMAALAAEIVPLRVLTRRYVEWVLQQTGGNKLRAAQLLGIDASTIYRMLLRDEPED